MALVGPLGALFLVLFSIATVAPVGASGSWSIVPSPNVGASTNGLVGVSCVSTAFCVGVGDYDKASAHSHRTLIESWDGTSWSVVPSPNKTGGNHLSGVSCTSATACVAVGFHGRYRTLVESWDGTSWSIVPSPNNGAAGSVLVDVSCTSSTSCTAVGYRWPTTRSAGTQTLIESWDGTSWSVVPSPNADTDGNYLVSVSCISATSCTAVGYNGGAETLIESWDGTSWTIVPSPDQGTFANYLLGVSCVSATSCTAVGQYDNGTLSTYQTLVESWDGTSWTIVPSPDQGTNISDLLDVSCASAGSCTAAGGYFNTTLHQVQTLILSWDGTSWTIVPSPNHGARYNILEGVSCLSDGSCTAVGNYHAGNPHIFQTLVESNG